MSLLGRQFAPLRDYLTRKSEFDAYAARNYPSPADLGRRQRVAKLWLGDDTRGAHQYDPEAQTKAAGNPANWSENTKRVMQNAELGQDGVNKPLPK